MMVIGIDAHKRSHTAVTVDEMGRQGFVKTVGTTTQDHLRLLKWAVGLAEEAVVGDRGLPAPDTAART
jgi:transposase